MKTIFLSLFLLPIFAVAQVHFTNLQLSDIVLTDKKGNSTNGHPMTILLEDGKSNPDNILISTSGITIIAKFKVSSIHSRRSSTKSGSIRLEVKYQSILGDKKDNRTAEYIYYIDDERQLEAKEMFVFNNGLSPIQYTLTFKGKFSN